MRRGLWGAVAVAAALAAGVPGVSAATGASGGADRCTVTELADDLGESLPVGQLSASLSADGSTAAFSSSETGELVVIDVDTQVRSVVPTDDLAFSPALSGDGERVAYVTGAFWTTPRGAIAELHVEVHDRTSGTTTRLTDEAGYNFQPAISRNGRTVAFNSNWTDLVIADLESDTTVTLPAALPNDDWFTFPVAVSPDGSQVAFRSSADLIGGDPRRTNRLYVYQVVDRSLAEINPMTSVGQPRFLDDGRLMLIGAGNGVPGQETSLWTYDLETESLSLLSRASWEPVVSGDASHVFETTNVDLVGTNPRGVPVSYGFDLRDGAVSQLTDDWAQPLASSADGGRVAAATFSGGHLRLALVTTCDPAPRADAAIATAATRLYVGDGVYAVNPTTAQKASVPIAAGASRSFLVRLQNDRTAVDSLTVAARDAGRPGYAVRYKHLGVDVTAEVEAGTFTVGPLGPGASAVLQVKVTADPGVPTGARHRVDVTARSVANPVAGDTVRARVTAFR